MPIISFLKILIRLWQVSDAGYGHLCFGCCKNINVFYWFMSNIPISTLLTPLHQPGSRVLKRMFLGFVAILWELLRCIYARRGLCKCVSLQVHKSPSQLLPKLHWGVTMNIYAVKGYLVRKSNPNVDKTSYLISLLCWLRSWLPDHISSFPNICWIKWSSQVLSV